MGVSQSQFSRNKATSHIPSPLRAHSLATGRRSALPPSCMNIHTVDILLHLSGRPTPSSDPYIRLADPHHPLSHTSAWQTHTFHCPIHLPDRHTINCSIHRNGRPILLIIPHIGTTHTIHCRTHRTADPGYPVSHTPDCRPTLPTVPYIGLQTHIIHCPTQQQTG